MGRGKFVAVGDHGLAIFHLSDPDRVIVTDDNCPHAGGSLAAGELEGNMIICSWHAWAFDLDTGKSAVAEHVTLRRYECRVEDGYVWARLPIETKSSSL